MFSNLTIVLFVQHCALCSFVHLKPQNKQSAVKKGACPVSRKASAGVTVGAHVHSRYGANDREWYTEAGKPGPV
ncbi:hypothetical protein ACOMHN_026457 [Nucella lapillus]